jgi:hypothetical protein
LLNEARHQVVRTISRKHHEMHELIEEDSHHKARQHSSKYTACRKCNHRKCNHKVSEINATRILSRT